MKKVSYLLTLFILLTAFTCENEPLEGEFGQDNEISCQAAAQNTQNAAVDFLDATDENYSQLCTAYRNALEIQIEFCGDPDGILQTQVDSLGNCSNGTQGDVEVPGTWLLTAWIGDEPIDLNNDGTESINFLDEIDCYDNETLLFNVDNTVVNTSTSFAIFEYIIEIGTTNSFIYTVTCEQELEVTNGTWSQNGNIVTISDPFGDFDLILDGDELSIFVPEGFQAINTDDVTVTTTQNLTFVYTKQ